MATSRGDVDGESSQSVSIEEQKELFTTATSQYFALLSSIDIGLRSQIKALKDADIIQKEAASRDSKTSQAVPVAFAALGSAATQPKQAGGTRAAISDGGLGSLDVGWLNSRNDHIGKGMEAELWEEAQQFVEKLRKEKASSNMKPSEANGHIIQEADQALGSPGDTSQMDQT